MVTDFFTHLIFIFETLTSNFNMSIIPEVENSTISSPSNILTPPTILPSCCFFIPGHEFSHCSFVSDGDLKYSIRNKPEWEMPITDIFPTKDTSDITFEVRRPKCAKGDHSIRLEFQSFERDYEGHFLSSGYFGYRDEYYHPYEYCINGITDEYVEVLTCEPECSDKSPCIRKCCRPDEIYSFDRRQCIKSNSAYYKPIFYHDMSNRLKPEEQEHVHPHYITNFPRSFKYKCGENRTQFFPASKTFSDYLSNFTRRRYNSAEFRVKTDGTIIFQTNGAIEGMKRLDGTIIYRNASARKCNKLVSEHYCIEGAEGYGNPNPFTNDEGEVFLATCAENLVETPMIGPLSRVYGNTMICSSFFSLLTVLVYLVLKEKRNIHGWTVMSYAISMFFMYIFLGLAHLIRYYTSNAVLKTDVCKFIGISSHFFSLSSFLWLTLINYDLWWTFRSIRPVAEYNVKRWNAYFKYSLFGWGIPIVIIIISLSLHFNYEEAAEFDCAEVHIPLPAYGRESCEIKQLSLGFYLYFPATALLLCNLIFFGVTTYKLCRHEQTTLIATRTTERHQHQSFQLFAKLFFVMGVTRVFEVITWAGSGPNLTWYWAVFDIFNVLQAVAIFIIYVCKRDVIQSLRKKFPLIERTWKNLKSFGCRKPRNTLLHRTSWIPQLVIKISEKSVKM